MCSIRAAAVALLTCVGSGAGAQGHVRASLAPTSRLWIEGTSNLHAWSCTTTTVSAAIEVDSARARVGDVLPKHLKNVQVQVPVRSLTCSPSGMDDNTYKALKADEVPTIVFIMTNFDTVTATGPNSFVVRATGSLSIAGRTNTVNLTVSGTRLPDGSIEATATVPIKMTDYGITPPTALLGTVKSGNDVNVKFQLILGPNTITAQPPR